MKPKVRSIEKIVDEQVHKWQISRAQPVARQVATPVVTISREPGSGGRILARQLAEKHSLDLFHQEVIHGMAARAKVSRQFLETLDEKGLSVLEDWVNSLVHERHLWPDQYLQHLMKVIGTIGKHGRAVIVGRGANFILPPEGRIRVRVVAPLERRIANVASTFGVSAEEARRRIIRTESDRRAFVRKYFNADITDPINYDLVLNTEILNIQTAADMLGAAVAAIVGGTAAVAAERPRRSKAG
jgi:cytidylate kinase